MASYVDSNLLPNERVMHRTQLHWIIYVPHVLLMLVGIGFVSIIFAWLDRLTTEMAVTDRRVIFKVGWISRRTVELRLQQVEAVLVNQGIFGRLFGYGDMTVVGTGGTKETFSAVIEPLYFRNVVNHYVDAMRRLPEPHAPTAHLLVTR